MRSLGLAAVLALAPVMVVADLPEPEIRPALVLDCLAQARTEAMAAETCIGLAALACMDLPGGGTTYGMNHCLGQEYELWDGLLNSHYRVVMEQSRAQDAEMADPASPLPEQAPALRDMQRQWMAFRNAACAFEHSRWGGGTGAGPAGTQCMLTLTARQALWLDQYRGEN